MLYVITVAAAVVLARRVAYPRLLAAVWAAIALIGSYSLVTRTFPDRVGTVDVLAGNRLSQPLGYWNGLAAFATLGLILGLGLATGARTLRLRAAAAASLPILAVVQYFTFSRGAWLALATGIGAALVIHPRRLNAVATGGAYVLLPALAVFLASRSDALTRSDALQADVSREGPVVAATVVLVSLANAAMAPAVTYATTRISLSRRLRGLIAVGLAAVAVIGVAAALIRVGGPLTVVGDAYDSLSSDPAADADLNQRLFSLGSRGRVEHWRVAWDTFSAHRVAGTGAGTYEQAWLMRRESDVKVRNAHSLYLETLAELGIVGFVLLVSALALPVFAAVKARGRNLVPAAFGGYVAYAAHAGIDWLWELPAVTLAALFTALAIVAAARGEARIVVDGPRRYAAVAALLAAAGFAFVGLKSNIALSESVDAFRTSDFTRARTKAHEAARWAPWSAQPWQRLGQAALAQGDLGEARRAFREGIEKDPHNWELWIGLASADSGPEGDRALARAAELNPQLLAR
jgi:hypothetical protein